jgi:hypothetical protein
MTPLICKAVRLAPEPETALWFDVGQMQPIPELLRAPNEVFMHLPYKRTGVVGVDTKNREFSFWMVQGENSVTVSGCSMDPLRYFEPIAYLMTEDGMRYYNNNKEVTQQEIIPMLRMVVAILLKLHSGGNAYRGTPQRTLINAKRKAKGKPALTFDWHTVTIEPSKPKNDPQGGTHASPRRHQARGHWRTYKSGKKGWVKECWKGDASKGTVFKDYKLKESND